MWELNSEHITESVSRLVFFQVLCCYRSFMLFSSFCCDVACEHLCLRLLLSNHAVTMDYFAKWGWKVVFEGFLWKGKFLSSSQSCMHCSGCYSGPELYNLCILFMIIMIFIVMNNGNGPPARIEFPGSPDGKLKSHLHRPYKIMMSTTTTLGWQISCNTGRPLAAQFFLFRNGLGNFR